MKKLFVLLVIVVGIFIVSDDENKTSANTAGNLTFDSNQEHTVVPYATFTRYWYDIVPPTYQGRQMFVTRNIHGHCMSGWLSANPIALGYFQYEGYLYPCNGPKPIPYKTPLEPVKTLNDSEQE